MTSSISVPEFLYRIAIDGLPLEMESIRSKCIYWIHIAAMDDSMLVAKSILNNADSKTRGVLIEANGFSLTDEDIESAASLHDLVTFSLTKNSLPALAALPLDLDRAMRPRQRTILLCLPSMMFAHSSREHLRKILFKWQAWLVSVDCAMLVLSSGNDALPLTDHLLAENDLLSGLAYINRDELGSISYQCLHWRNISGVAAPRTLMLNHDDINLSVVGSMELNDPISSSNLPGRYIVESAALSGFSMAPQKGWEIVESSSAAYQLARTATNATVLFALHKHSQLPELAKLLHALRLERGPVPRLVVRELSTPLRFQDEQTLLDCGASLVIGGEMGYTRFWSLLESIQPMRYNRKLVETPDRLFVLSKIGDAQGIVDATAFIKHVKCIFSGSLNLHKSGILVQMVPVPGLTADEALHILNLRRVEDVACMLAGNVYLFLYGCLPSLTNRVLEKLFLLPFDEIFSAHTVCEDGDSVLAALEQMQTDIKYEFAHSTIQSESTALENVMNPNEPPDSGVRANRYVPTRVTIEID